MVTIICMKRADLSQKLAILLSKLYRNSVKCNADEKQRAFTFKVKVVPYN